MDLGALALMIPILAMLIPFFAIWTRHRSQMAEMQVQATAEKAAQYAAQNASNNRELEERVRVLERIVTDRGYDIAAQIEALRDARAVETVRDGER